MSRDKQGYRGFLRYLEECALDGPLRAIGQRHGVSLQEAYSNARGRSVVAARLEMWHWLTSEMGRSPGEIAKIFDRDRGAVAFALKRLRECAEQLELSVDAGTVTAISRHVAGAGSGRAA